MTHRLKWKRSQVGARRFGQRTRQQLRTGSLGCYDHQHFRVVREGVRELQQQRWIVLHAQGAGVQKNEAVVQTVGPTPVVVAWPARQLAQSAPVRNDADAGLIEPERLELG